MGNHFCANAQLHNTDYIYIHRSFRLLVVTASFSLIQLILRKKNCCHQMSDFKAKMHEIIFWLGLAAADPTGGAYSAPQTP